MDQLPKYQELIPPLLRVLTKAGGPLSNAEIESKVIQDLGIPTSLAASIHSGNRTELQYRLAWARTKAKSSGWIESPGRETWKITPSGSSQN
jgi:restriction system protein